MRTAGWLDLLDSLELKNPSCNQSFLLSSALRFGVRLVSLQLPPSGPAPPPYCVPFPCLPQVPRSCQAATPVLLLATAGLRLLEQPVAEAVLAASRPVLVSSSLPPQTPILERASAHTAALLPRRAAAPGTPGSLPGNAAGRRCCKARSGGLCGALRRCRAVRLSSCWVLLVPVGSCRRPAPSCSAASGPPSYRAGTRASTLGLRPTT